MAELADAADSKSVQPLYKPLWKIEQISRLARVFGHSKLPRCTPLLGWSLATTRELFHLTETSAFIAT